MYASWSVSPPIARPSHVFHAMIIAQPAAAIAIARNETWFGVTGVSFMSHTSTAAGGRETHSVQRLSFRFFDCL